MAKRGGFPGGMPGNMNNLMKQAQRMQRQMEETTKELEEKQGGKKPGVAFMHIAPPEYMYAYNVGPLCCNDL